MPFPYLSTQNRQNSQFRRSRFGWKVRPRQKDGPIRIEYYIIEPCFKLLAKIDKRSMSPSFLLVLDGLYPEAILQGGNVVFTPFKSVKNIDLRLFNWRKNSVANLQESPLSESAEHSFVSFTSVKSICMYNCIVLISLKLKYL